MKKVNQDLYIGIILLLIGSFFLYLTSQFRGGAEIFPKIILILFVFLSLLLIASSLKNNEKKQKQVAFSEIKQPLIIFVFALVYIFGLKQIGFIISTLIFIPAIMFYYKNKQKLLYVFCTLGTILFMYILFNIVLKLQLP